jgi:hypothetical protein
MVPMGLPLYGLAGAKRTLGGGGKDPSPTGPAHNVNPLEQIEAVVEDALILSNSTTYTKKKNLNFGFWI